MTNTVKRGYVRRLDLNHGRVDMSHGSGGRAMAQLIEELFAAAFDNDYLRQGNDGAVLPAAAGRLVMATDSHVVSPLFFPGGDIGCLSVHGTINDVAVMGATPLYLAAGFILEEGFALADLQRIVASMADAARLAGVPVVTGDTKVVEQGKGDGVFITTTGVGVVREGVNVSGDRARPGDRIIVSGTLGDHGMAIMAQRESLGFSSTIVSDTAALHGLIAALLDTGVDVHVLRDPTRGGLATTLNEIARQSQVGMMLDETALPVNPEVAAACEFLGLDPLYVANEGKLVAIVAGAGRPARPSARGARRHRRHGARGRAAFRADDHRLRRPAHRRLAVGRTVAAHLLNAMRILFLTHGFNSLTQRLFAELSGRGHELSIEFDIADSVAEEAVALFRPDLIVAPYLRRAIPESLWRGHVCLVVHPGVVGDRGPSALDWAIQENERAWGVTVLQAEAEMDAGPVWADEAFVMRPATKASLYRNEVTEAACRAVLRAVERFAAAEFRPTPLAAAEGRGRWPPCAPIRSGRAPPSSARCTRTRSISCR